MSDPVEPADWDEAWRQARAYQPCFCEENVWRLLGEQVLPEPGAAVFVTNADRTVAMWGQRAADHDPIVWDYHAVALLPRRRFIVDLDDRRRVAWPLAAWLRHAFRDDTEEDLRPAFRIVPRDEFLATFSSDRSHMRDARGQPQQPFPPWPAPFQAALGMNLPRFLDLRDAIAGIVTDADGLLRFAAH